MDREIDIDEPMSMMDDEEGEIQEKTDQGTSDHLHDSSLMLRKQSKFYICIDCIRAVFPQCAP